jgi:hypothetical protein
MPNHNTFKRRTIPVWETACFAGACIVIGAVAVVAAGFEDAEEVKTV